MDLLIYTGATDITAAAVTSASDITPLELPDDLAQLVLGTTEPMTVKFLSGASAYESWSGDATYTVTASLGEVTADGLSVYAEGTLSTGITNGKSGDLGLDTAALADALRLALNGTRRGTLGLVLQITVTDPDGDRRIFAQLPVSVNGRVSTFSPASIALPSQTFLTASEIAAIYLTRATGYHAQTAAAAGTYTITPASTDPIHSELITVTGAAGTYVVPVVITGRTAGDTVFLKLVLPSTSGITVELRDATAAGTLLASVTTDGTAGVVGMATTYNGSAWGEPWAGGWVD